MEGTDPDDSRRNFHSPREQISVGRHAGPADAGAIIFLSPLPPAGPRHIVPPVDFRPIHVEDPPARGLLPRRPWIAGLIFHSRFTKKGFFLRFGLELNEMAVAAKRLIIIGHRPDHGLIRDPAPAIDSRIPEELLFEYNIPPGKLWLNQSFPVV